MNKWKIIKISDLATTQSGGTPSTTRSDYWDGNIPWINSGELKDCLIKKASKYITKIGLENSSARLFPKGTVVIALTGATTAKLGILEFETSTNQSLTGILPNKEFHSKFLFYQLLSLRKEILSKSLGTAQPHINKRIVDEIIVKLPPVYEQQAIVSKIEELLSELENGKQQLQIAQQQLKVYRQNLLKWAFEGKLSEDWRKNQQCLTTSTELLRKIQFEKEKNAKTSGKKLRPLIPIKENERTELPKLPKEWIWVKLGDNAFVTKLAGFEFTKYVKYKKDGDIPVIRAQNVLKYSFIPRNFLYVDREIMEKLPRSRIYGGEILLVFVGAGLGNVGIVPTNQEYFLGPNVAKVVLEKQFTTKFIFHFLTSQLGCANVTGMSKATAQGSISMANIREVTVPLISIEEQNYITDQLENKFTICDKLEETINQGLQQSETLKQSILKKAFEGKLI